MRQFTKRRLQLSAIMLALVTFSVVTTFSTNNPTYLHYAITGAGGGVVLWTLFRMWVLDR